MIEPRLTPAQWMEIKPEVRHKMIAVFSIPISGTGTMHQDAMGKITANDGHTGNDLSCVSVEAMQSYLGTTDTDFFTLLNETVERLKVVEQSGLAEQYAKAKQASVARWTLTLREIERQAKEFGLEEEFNSLVVDIFNVKSNQKIPAVDATGPAQAPKDVEGGKKRGRPSKKIS